MHAASTTHALTFLGSFNRGSSLHVVVTTAEAVEAKAAVPSSEATAEIRLDLSTALEALVSACKCVKACSSVSL